MAGKGIGPLLLLGGLGALVLAGRRGGDGAPAIGDVVAEGTRYDGLNRPGLYRISTVPLTEGFAFGPGNIGFLPEIKEPRGNWISQVIGANDVVMGGRPYESVEDAESVAISMLEQRGFIKDAQG